MTATINCMLERLPGSSKRPNALPALERLRAAQTLWQAQPFAERLKRIGRIAGTIAEHSEELTQSVHRPAATLGEILASEVLPLAEACRYTARRGASILKPRQLPQRDRVWWMGSVYVTELREPLGVVFIIGPSNYPLFLPGVQLIQALAAGNAAIVKPAPGCEEAMRSLTRLCVQTGIPADLIHQLDSDPISAQDAIEAGVDKVLFTGSLATGRKVAALCSEHMTPSAMELSGNDAILVSDDADLPRVASCVAYALSLNGGQTCIAPRRLFASSKTLHHLVPLLTEQLKQTPARSISARGLQFARQLTQSALADGARIAFGQLEDFEDPERVRPIVLANVRSDMPLAQEDIFAPLLSLIEVQDLQDAISQASQSPYALGAAIFSQSPDVKSLASQIAAGCVTINDVLVPTADPRVSFGGRQASGFGVTRGLEGLRELTQLKVVCTRRGRWLPHLTTNDKQLATMLDGILKLRHGQNWAQRWAGIKSLMKVGRAK